MFEKEAEKYVIKKHHIDKTKLPIDFSLRCEFSDDFTDFQKGAEFGYNKAFVEADKNLKAIVTDFNKANEWHYVKDGKYPAHSNRVLVFTDEGVGFGIYGLDNQKWYTYDTGFDVIAWKEIVLPELQKESK